MVTSSTSGSTSRRLAGSEQRRLAFEPWMRGTRRKKLIWRGRWRPRHVIPICFAPARHWPKMTCRPPKPCFVPVSSDGPTDVAAIRMMAELAARVGRLGDAGEPAAPRAGAGARLHGRARQSRDRALQAEQGRRGDRRAGADRAGWHDQSRPRQSQGRRARPDRRSRRGDRASIANCSMFGPTSPNCG